MSGARTVVVEPAQADQRVDEAVASLLGVSVAAVKRLCARELLLRRGVRLRKGERVCAGDVITLLAAPVDTSPPPELGVLLQQGPFVVVDKPAGLPSHRLHPSDPPAALDAVVARWPAAATAGPDPREGGLLHRLDVGTSGALAFALEPRAFEAGRAAFKGGHARKLYLALVHGAVADRGEVDAPVAHDPGDPRRSVVVAEQGARHRGRPRQAVTRWRVLTRHGAEALVLVDGEGGRRHQVRVHLAHAGAPLWGDDLYGGPPWPVGGPRLPSHALHAVWLGFTAAEARVEATAPVPGAFRAVVESVLGGVTRALDEAERQPTAVW
ncbi:MAG: RluA family pseudouridine synthase [Deltaproteobacteria bacterium]|nr:RluA family pseudouridine synthase [Deltaproteobacteria bacterium]